MIGDKLGSRFQGMIKGVYAPIWFVVVIILPLGAYAALHKPHPVTLVTEHHVAILGKLADGDFAFRSDEETNGGAFRPCKADIDSGVDVDGMLTHGIGFVADYAIWEERGACKSILTADQGFWFRDANNNFTYQKIAKGE